MYVKRIVAMIATVFITAGVMIGFVPQSANASALSLRVHAASTVAAPDIKSKGYVITPSTEITGDDYNSYLYDWRYSSVVYHGKKKVASTSEEGKAIKVKPGTYTVKTTAKYRISTWRHKSDIRWGWGYEWGPYPTEDGCQMQRTSAGTPTSYYYSWTTFDAEIKCTDGRRAKGTLDWYTYYDDGSELESIWPLNAYVTVDPTESISWNQTDAYGPTDNSYDYESLGAWKTVTKSSTVKVGKNSGVMTLYEYKKVKSKAKKSKVDKIVGGKGKVVSRYSYGKHNYLDVAYGNHYVYFDNGKVYAKSW